MKSFQSRLNRIQAKQDIMYSRNEDFSFPRLQKNNNRTIFEMPPEEEILSTIKRARECAYETLISLGIEQANIDFSDSVSLRQSQTKPAQFEFVSIDTNEHFEMHIDSLDANICEAEELLYNTGQELNLKDSKCSTRHTFAIRNKNGKVIHVKKSTLLWMITNGTQRCSSDRSYRFREMPVSNKIAIREQNKVLTTMRCGEWIVLKCNDSVNVVKIYGFRYLSGKRTAYTLDEAYVHPPSDSSAKGVGVVGSYFTVILSENITLELNEESSELIIDTQQYLSHLEKPESNGYNIFYSLSTSQYIRSLVKYQLQDEQNI
ncbi:uncharacterized protein LOC131691779 [Topomyia yanbarensis]|uniref:uncharacterized protein LOC131691779 n=1 Tax=Topomyia yanbarensis TaxID=2498891 RepID=UPI00273B5233|nr:uncharacterized protein LOC131691779 [Topomyia yanbarensis]